MPSPRPYLTKSDFKACLDCRTKLFYRKHRYPSNLDENEYLRFLADGGFMVEFVAKARFPGAHDLAGERDPETAFSRTQTLLANDDTTLFEAAAISGKYQVRTDILRREGGTLHLIEVKSASLGDDDDPLSPFLTKRGTVDSRWREYLMDVAFQTYVVQQAFPQFRVKPQLCVVNKSAPVTPAETLDRFTLRKDASNPKARPEVIYRGDVAALAKSKLLAFRPVEHEVALLMPEVLQRAEALAALLTPTGVTRVQEDIAGHYRSCRVCEYRVKDADKSGFRECWGKLANATPHILDLHQVGRIGTTRRPDPVPALLKRGRASLLDLNADDLGAEESPLRERRFMQWSSMRAGGVERLPAALRKELASHQRAPGWPLHFVDFEACDIALPHHAGLRPYERVAFQWSCHTLQRDGTLDHAEWLNTKREFPNFAFARALRERLGEEGTVYVWSAYEQTTLRRILEQLAGGMARNPDEAARLAGVSAPSALKALADWIDRLLGPEDAKGKRHSPRIRDLHDLAKRHYFHPLMGGRTSIKVVLPAVWSADECLWRHPAFQKYYRQDETARPLDPYKVLPALPLGGEENGEDAVREGTGAIRVYQELIFATDQSPERHAACQKLLSQYCELDTAAMVTIWIHWIT